MPRFHGYREKIAANFYDAFEPMTAFASANICRVFDNHKSLGNAHRTNMLTMGALPTGQAMAISGLYARTNVHSNPGCAIWDEWLQRTTATLYVGDKLMITTPLSELVLGRLRDDESPDTDKASRLAFTLHSNVEPNDTELQAWLRRDDEVRAFWESRARRAMRALSYRRPWIIPVDCRFHVLVTTEALSTGLLIQHRPELTWAIGDPLVWIHAEGILTRSVA